MELTLAQLADQYRNQRDMLAKGLAAIVRNDAEGKGYFAKMAEETLARMLATTHEGHPALDDEYCGCGRGMTTDQEHEAGVCRECL